RGKERVRKRVARAVPGRLDAGRARTARAPGILLLRRQPAGHHRALPGKARRFRAAAAARRDPPERHPPGAGGARADAPP
nr:hypothetical protein [Tanacetum cinerariifolium]